MLPKRPQTTPKHPPKRPPDTLRKQIKNMFKQISESQNRNMVPKAIAKSSQSHRRKARYLRMFRKVIAARHVIYGQIRKVIAKSSQRTRNLRRFRKVIAARHVIYGDFAKSSPQGTLFTDKFAKSSQSHRRNSRNH